MVSIFNISDFQNLGFMTRSKDLTGCVTGGILISKHKFPPWPFFYTIFAGYVIIMILCRMAYSLCLTVIP